jgi:hypothetical protein
MIIDGYHVMPDTGLWIPGVKGIHFFIYPHKRTGSLTSIKYQASRIALHSSKTINVSTRRFPSKRAGQETD